MMTFILIIHSIVCVLLVLTILMQSGRGGGLTEQFQSAESVFGAQTNVFMVRLSSILATIFFVTCLALAFMSARQERSLVAENAAAKKTAAGVTFPMEPGTKDQVSTNAVMPVEENALPAQTAPETEAVAPEVQTPVTTNAQ
jgi:preprotein translocase subunit SecG